MHGESWKRWKYKWQERRKNTRKGKTLEPVHVSNQGSLGWYLTFPRRNSSKVFSLPKHRSDQSDVPGLYRDSILYKGSQWFRFDTVGSLVSSVGFGVSLFYRFSMFKSTSFSFIPGGFRPLLDRQRRTDPS